MKLPFILLADSDSDRRHTFITAFEKQVAYAAVYPVDDGQLLLAFLSNCGWKDIPSLIILNCPLRDATAPELLRALLPDPRYLSIPKIVFAPDDEKMEIEESKMLGVSHCLKIPADIFELEYNVHIIDNLLKSELDLV